jgi:hypothetical protein
MAPVVMLFCNWIVDPLETFTPDTVPSAPEACRFRIPPLIDTGPEIVLMLAKVKMPLPVLLIPPVKLLGVLNVTLPEPVIISVEDPPMPAEPLIT